MAGLTCAHALHAQGYAVTILEKSRGIGGRIATRRTDQGLHFDHGAQFVTSRTPAFQAFIDHGLSAGHVGLWRPGGESANATDDGWFVGKSRMNDMLRPMAEQLPIRFQTEVVDVVAAGDAVRVLDGQGDALGEFDQLICTAPPARAIRLTAGCAPELAEVLNTVSVAPAWALMFSVPGSLDAGFDMARRREGPIATLTRNSSKPDRAPTPECWVAHASPAWSRSHLEWDRADIIAALLELIHAEFGLPIDQVDYRAAHRWRYAMTETPLGRPFAEGCDGRVLVGGDWCLGARVEAAFESGLAMAHRIMDRS